MNTSTMVGLMAYPKWQEWTMGIYRNTCSQCLDKRSKFGLHVYFCCYESPLSKWWIATGGVSH